MKEEEKIIETKTPLPVVGVEPLVMLPCPFCGAQPTKEKDWMDAKVYISCHCLASPCISVQATCVRNPGESETYRPLFDEAFKIAIMAWNTRVVAIPF